MCAKGKQIVYACHTAIYEQGKIFTKVKYTTLSEVTEHISPQHELRYQYGCNTDEMRNASVLIA